MVTGLYRQAIMWDTYTQCESQVGNMELLPGRADGKSRECHPVNAGEAHKIIQTFPADGAECSAVEQIQGLMIIVVQL